MMNNGKERCIFMLDNRTAIFISLDKNFPFSNSILSQDKNLLYDVPLNSQAHCRLDDMG